MFCNYRLRRVERSIIITHVKLDALMRQVRAIRRGLYEETETMADVADDIIAKLEEANTKQDGFLVILQSLKDNQNNPAKLKQIAQSITEQQSDWEVAFTANTEEEPVVDPVS